MNICHLGPSLRSFKNTEPAVQTSGKLDDGGLFAAVTVSPKQMIKLKVEKSVVGDRQ